MARYLLDTTVLINHMRGREAAVQLLTRLAREGHELGVCAINVAELYGGLRVEERVHADRLVESLDCYTITLKAAAEAGRYRYDHARRGRTLTVADTLVAATAVAEGAVLVTANARDFPMQDVQLLEQPWNMVGSPFAGQRDRLTDQRAGATLRTLPNPPSPARKAQASPAKEGSRGAALTGTEGHR